MSHNHGRSKLELSLSRALWHRGVRYFTSAGYKSLSGTKLPGSPDLVFPRKRTVVFVDGCFWHGCPSCHGIPKRSGVYWENKITENRERDQRVGRELTDAGWAVIRLPEHTLKPSSKLEAAADELVSQLSGSPGPPQCLLD